MTTEKPQPIGAMASIRWHDGTEGDGYYFSFSDDFEGGIIDENGDSISDMHGVPDEVIFYYVRSEEQLKNFMKQGAVDFIVLDYKVVYASEEDANQVGEQNEPR